MSGTAPNEVELYIAELRPHLEALPEADREELLADLAAHLSEVAAESSEPLRAVVGDPDAFARELLTSAGTAVLAPPPRLRATNPLGVVARTPTWQAAEPTLELLRPAWWVLRGYVAALVFSSATQNGTLDSFPLPTLFGSAGLGLVLALAAVAGSVALGTRTTPRLRWWLLAPNLLLLLGCFVVAGRVHSSLNRGSYPIVAPAPPYLEDGGYTMDPYDANGKPIYPYGAPIPNEFLRIVLVPTMTPDGRIHLAPVGPAPPRPVRPAKRHR